VAGPDREAPFLRRRGVSRKRGKPPALRLAALSATVLAAAFGLFHFLGGPHFATRRFEITGNSRARTEEILTALSEWNGRNLVSLDLAPLATKLAAHPWIDRVTLTKRFPDQLSVRVTERRAIALYRENDLFWWVGAEGRLIAPYDARRDREHRRELHDAARSRRKFDDETVGVAPEAEEVDVQINDSDLRIDVYRSSGPGGQSVNTTDSRVELRWDVAASAALVERTTFSVPSSPAPPPVVTTPPKPPARPPGAAGWCGRRC